MNHGGGWAATVTLGDVDILTSQGRWGHNEEDDEYAPGTRFRISFCRFSSRDPRPRLQHGAHHLLGCVAHDGHLAAVRLPTRHICSKIYPFAFMYGAHWTLNYGRRSSSRASLSFSVVGLNEMISCQTRAEAPEPRHNPDTHCYYHYHYHYRSYDAWCICSTQF